jgi:opacity protein-like surface antigen
MIRLLIAAVLLTAAVAPAIACEWNQTVSTDTKSKTVASQPSDDQTTPAPTPPASQKPS